MKVILGLEAFPISLVNISENTYNGLATCRLRSTLAAFYAERI